MKKETYFKPELDVVGFLVADIIRTSPVIDNDDNQGEWDEQ